ncbi:MAG: efflux RND transporter permease subunit [Deltaproteobacteria bacterium]|nr:efflux RND transporter permease subunit [Deltaproteobacteria bacterium]
MRAFIETCLRQRWVVLGLTLVFVAVALRGVSDARFDAFPEFAPPRVEIQTEAPGLSSEEVEALVTTPLEAALAGTPGTTAMRSRSVLGLSSIVLLFPNGTDLLTARALVQERVSRALPQLPVVSRPPVLLSPLSSTSRILKVGLWSESLDTLALTDLARWTVRPALMAIPGVANVAIWGERDRRLEVRVDPDRLAAHGVDLGRVSMVTREAVLPRSGGFIDGPTTRLAMIHAPVALDAASLARVPIGGLGRSTLAIGDVADVVEDHGAPIGSGLVTRGAGLLLIVEKQPGASTLEVTRAVDRVLGSLAPGMQGVEVDATIFRPASFIERALSNLGEAMGIGCAFVVVVLFLFLWNARTAMISVLAIPLSLLAAALTLTWMGTTIDTMVIAGLVIALGEVVDDAIIDVENIHRRLVELPPDASLAARVSLIVEASLEVRSAIVYASLVVILVFVPVLFLGGVAGEFFRPLALSYGLAVLASTVVALTITPVLASFLLRGGHASETSAPIARLLLRLYAPMVRRAIEAPRLLVGVTLLLLVGAGALAGGLREEFLPHFAENDFLMHWIARPGTSLAAVERSADRARVELLAVPGVRSFGAHIGRAEVADEVVGPNFAELWISVDPEADLPATQARVNEVVDGYPGVYRDVQTYLQERMREVLSGGGAPIVVRIRGTDLPAMRAAATSLAHELESIPGIAHAHPEAQVLVPQVEIRMDLERCAALGVEPGLVRTRAATLLSGEVVGQIVRGLQPLDVVVWAEERVRGDVAAVRDLAIAVDGRTVVRLGDVADVSIVPMPNTIAHDASTRKIDVLIDLAPGADLGGVGDAVAAHVAAMTLPTAHHADVLGEGAARAEARSRLFAVAALALLGIFLVLLADFGTPRLALLVFAGLPFALVGGVVAAASSGVVSLGTLIGLVAVIGIAARNGIMLVSHFRHLEAVEGVPFGPELVVRGATERLAPILMTALATGLALLPVALGGDTAGHEIEHPMAVVILGGLVSSTMLTLLVTPAIYLRWGRAGHETDAAVRATRD